MSDRYEARLLEPIGEAPALWGAWDTKRGDWLRVPGPERRPEWFTSSERVSAWAAQEAQRDQHPGSSLVAEEPPRLDVEGTCDRRQGVGVRRRHPEFVLADRAPVEPGQRAETLLTEAVPGTESSNPATDGPP